MEENGELNAKNIFHICQKDYLMASYIVFSSKLCCDRGKSLKMLLFVSILVKLLLQCYRKVTNLVLASNWHETRNQYYHFDLSLYFLLFFLSYAMLLSFYALNKTQGTCPGKFSFSQIQARFGLLKVVVT